MKKFIREVKEDSGITRYDVYEVSKAEFYEYLKSYTSGDSNTIVVANGPNNSFETWCRMCGQGKSIRERPLQDERRALHHPKQATPETLIKAIADWEKRYAAYILQKPKDSISPEKKLCVLGTSSRSAARSS